MYIKKSKVIMIGKEAFCYLWNRERAERGFSPTPDERLNYLWDRCHKVNGLKDIDGDSFVWTVDRIIEILKENGFDYTPAEDRESICIGLGDFQ